MGRLSIKLQRHLQNFVKVAQHQHNNNNRNRERQREREIQRRKYEKQRVGAGVREVGKLEGSICQSLAISKIFAWGEQDFGQPQREKTKVCTLDCEL